MQERVRGVAPYRAVMSVPSAMFRAMLMLHTSDWHLGRSLHRADLRAAQAAFLDHLVSTVRAEKVDVVLVAGDVYDRAVPPVDAVEMCEDALLRLHGTGARIVLISGNHDSARRLGFGAGLLDKTGVHLRTQVAKLARPVLLEDAHGPVAVYGVPYLEPDAVRGELPHDLEGHAGVLGYAVRCIQADADARGVRRRVVMAHGWVTGGAASESERDITVGGVGQVPADTFNGLSYVALGHLHGQQTLAGHLRYSGSPLPYSFSEATHRKGSWLVELDANGIARAERVPAPQYRRLSLLRGRLADLLGSARLHRIRGRLRVGHPHRPEPARGSDGRAADPVPAHPGARLRARRRRARRRLLPGPGRRPRRPGHRGGVRPARQERSGHRRRTAAAHRRVRGRPHGGGRLMRPHRLRVTAFGAFGGTVEVCFDDLASAGLFLLHGETGAGKTTLLDAIGFALYGRVPGERGKARRLRSDHAAPGTPTEVQLEATMGGRRIRITRKPEQQRPKRRGGGTTTEQAKILLEESDGGTWRAVSTRAGEADDEIKDLMGMSAEQFYQVVLLPQGQFAQFLHADATDRQRLLQKLFGTDRFRAVEDWLADRRRTTARAVEESELAVKELAARVAQVVGSAAAPPGDPDPSTADSAAPPAADPTTVPAAPPATRTRCPIPPGPPGWPRPPPRRPPPARLRSAAAAPSSIRPRTASATRSAWPTASAGAPRLSAPATSWPRPSRASTSCTASSPPLPAPPRPPGRSARPNAPATRWPRPGPNRSRPGATSRFSPAPMSTATAPELRAAGQEHVARLGRLDALRSLDQQAAGEDENAKAARVAADALTAQLADAEALLTTRQQQRPGLVAERDQARQAGQELPAHAAAADTCRRAADDASALVKARTDARRQEDAYFSARLETSDLRDQASRLREARIDGMRAELAATLVDGAPCPVCGSLDHPELCELRGERVTREQEEAADAEAAAAADRAEIFGAKLAAADILVGDLTARLEAAGFTVPADLATLEAEAARLAVRADEMAAQAA